MESFPSSEMIEKSDLFGCFFCKKVDVEFCWSNSSQTGFFNDLPNLGCNQGPHHFDDFRRLVKLQRSLWGISRWASKPCRFSYMVTSLGDDFATVSTRNYWRFPKSFTFFLVVFLLVSSFDSTTTPRYSSSRIQTCIKHACWILLLMVQKSQTTHRLDAQKLVNSEINHWKPQLVNAGFLNH